MHPGSGGICSSNRVAMSALQYDGACHFDFFDRKDLFFPYDSTERKRRSHSVSLIVFLLTH